MIGGPAGIESTIYYLSTLLLLVEERSEARRHEVTKGRMEEKDRDRDREKAYRHV